MPLLRHVGKLSLSERVWQSGTFGWRQVQPTAATTSCTASGVRLQSKCNVEKHGRMGKTHMDFVMTVLTAVAWPVIGWMCIRLVRFMTTYESGSDLIGQDSFLCPYYCVDIRYVSHESKTNWIWVTFAFNVNIAYDNWPAPFANEDNVIWSKFTTATKWTTNATYFNKASHAKAIYLTVTRMTCGVVMSELSLPQTLLSDLYWRCQMQLSAVYPNQHQQHIVEMSASIVSAC